MGEPTPGPWSVSDVLYRWDMVDRQNVDDANGEFVCMTHANSPNLPLIAAAPDLLAHLEIAVEDYLSDYGRPTAPEHWVNTARDALAKAKGAQE